MMARTFGCYGPLRCDDVMSAYRAGIDGYFALARRPRHPGESISAQSACGL